MDRFDITRDTTDEHVGIRESRKRHTGRASAFDIARDVMYRATGAYGPNEAELQVQAQAAPDDVTPSAAEPKAAYRGVRRLALPLLLVRRMFY